MRARRFLAIVLVIAAAPGLVAGGASREPAQPATREGSGVIALVTGSTSGLGREVARRLAERGMHVIVHGRDRAKGEALVREIRARGGGARFYAADFARLADVRRLAEAVARDYDRLNLLVNNAGIGLLRGGARRVSADGYELHFQVNYLAHFLLTDLLLPLLERGAPARIVNVASGAQHPIDFDDPQIERDYSAWRAYGQSKLAQITYTRTLAERLAGSGISVLSLHPATFMDTAMVREAGIAPQSTVAEGAAAVIQLAIGEGFESGAYFSGLRPARAHPQAYERAAQERLWSLSCELTARRE